jgi:hypothetical protein
MTLFTKNTQRSSLWQTNSISLCKRLVLLKNYFFSFTIVKSQQQHDHCASLQARLRNFCFSAFPLSTFFSKDQRCSASFKFWSAGYSFCQTKVLDILTVLWLFSSKATLEDWCSMQTYLVVLNIMQYTYMTFPFLSTNGTTMSCKN